MQRFDEIENLNHMAKKNKVFDEKRLREKTIAERNEILRQEREAELENDRNYIEKINHDIREEHQKIIQERVHEREK